MSLSCSNQHIPYGKWRLRVLRVLYSPTVPQIGYNPPFQYRQSIHPIRPTQLRFYNCSSFLCAPKPRDDGNSSEGTIISNEQSSTIQSSGTVNKSSQDSNAQDQTSKQRRPRKFSPFSESGRQQLKDLVQDLQQITKENVIEQEGTKTKASNESEQYGSRQLLGFRPGAKHFPESPVTRRLKKQRLHKRKASWEEKQKLKSNPWAQMLAGSIRLCQASYARLPTDLMLQWGLVKHPENGNVYLMPDKLSDMQELGVDNQNEVGNLQDNDIVVDGNETQKFEGLQPTEDERSVDTISAHRSKGSRSTAASSGELTQQPHPQMHSALRITSSQNLLRHLSALFINQDSKDSSKTPSIIRNNMKRIFPGRWKQQIATAQHYNRNRKHLDAATSREDASSDGPFEMQVDLSKVLWQADIPDRVLDMMRLRVLAAVNQLATRASTGRGLHQKRILTLQVPKNGKLEFKDGKIGEELNNNVHIEPISTEIPAEVDRTNISTEESSSPSILGTEWLSGSFFLHIGSTTTILDSSLKSTQHPDSSTSISLDSLPTHPLIPSMVSINDTHRLPVFPLSFLLGRQHYTDFQASLLKHKVLHLDINNDENASSHEPDSRTEYLILIKSVTQESTKLAFEVWQLWRYMGGFQSKIG